MGPSVYHWDRGAGTDNWTDGANWYNSTSSSNNQVPVAGADLVFGNRPSGTDAQTVVLNSTNTAVRSIWFEAGRDYTFQGTGSLILGGGLANNGRLVTVFARGLPANHHTINLPISLAAGPAKTFEIANYSAGSILGFRGNFNLNGHSLRFTGTGPIYFEPSLILSNGASLSTVASSTTYPTILIIRNILLSGGNAATTQLTVGSNTLVIGRGLGTGVGVMVQSGGSYSMRAQSNVSGTLAGAGLARQAAAAPIGALYADGFISGRVNVSLVGNTSFGVRSGRGDAYVVTGGNVAVGTSSGFIKVDSGIVYFPSVDKGRQPAQNNLWQGVTAINGGVLRYGLASQNAWAGIVFTSTRLQLNGGILETDSNTAFTLGTGAGQVEWRGDGGFSSAVLNGAARAVILYTPGSSSPASLTWGTGFFVRTGRKLLLSSRYATGEIVFTNGIDLGSQLREVRVERGVRATLQGVVQENARARMSGALTGTNGGILKTGPGLLRLTGANSYTGATVIREGALRGNIPTSSNIRLSGGVLGLDADFTRPRFGPNGRIIWEGSGGFAAYGANRRVRIDNQTTTEIVWGSSNFVQSRQELRFGHYTADAAVIWDRVLNFGNAMRTIRVERGQALRGGAPNLTDVIFNRELRNSTKAGGLRLVGAGRADLAADNSSLNSDVLEISGAELAIATSNARLGAVGTIALSEGGRFTIRNVGSGSYNNAQVADTTKVTLNTGILRYEGRTTGNLPSVETIGDVTLESGANEIRLQHNLLAGNSYTELGVGEFKRASSSRATLDLTSNADVTGANASLYTYSATGKVRLRAAITTLSGQMIGGIAPWATINGTDWARRATTSGADYIANFASYTTGSTHSGNYRPSTAVTTFGPVTLNSLRLAVSSFGAPSRANLDGALTLSSGGLLASRVGPNTTAFHIIAGTGTLRTVGGRPLYTHVYGNGLEFTGSVRVIGGMDWVKTGPSRLRYISTGTSEIGSLYIHQGRFELVTGSINTGAAGQVYIGDGAGRDELWLSGGNNRLADRPKVTLRGTPYGRGAEFGAAEDQATLILRNGASQGLRELHIIDRGTIDFANGNPGAPNRLFLDLLTFNNSSARLFVRGWHEYEDFLLIKRTAFAAGQWPNLLSQIFFDGYSRDYELLLKDYDVNYYEITPWSSWATSALPEPSTYGALLAAAGIALVAWRKKRAAKASPLTATQ
ncbi:autotransporter-associated beta strand repeat-containing protein [Cephaloticoccus capnophilus]|uniref:autotransporter-associated beta strand repeat-containing protein n=1 Tax=Cephaloticoccus capnophilus TaxID=1548208 RepID=UPI0018D4662F|nr:autotransporter-associated beta strand repeat-containing protein [Cephaloticoccus capnophilus]